MSVNSKILVAPLNWGLGHATRCIPIIRELEARDFEPILASDGEALILLKKEFPHLKTFQLPSYGIKYSKSRLFFKAKLLSNSLKVLQAIRKEHFQTRQLVSELGVVGIISDNRLGVRHDHIPSVIITHQLKVLSGETTTLSTALHNHFIKKFDQCWVPDSDSNENLSGAMSHGVKLKIPVSYIGPISRFRKMDVPEKYKIAVILSGPEPQRSLLENRLCHELENFEGNIIMIQGKMSDLQNRYEEGHIRKVNFMTAAELEAVINSSGTIISRSGYTTIMDLAKLGKKAFFIPTPGQYEQEYLAKRLDSMRIVPACSQSDFTMEQLKRLDAFSGFSAEKSRTDFDRLFSFFKGE